MNSPHETLAREFKALAQREGRGVWREEEPLFKHTTLRVGGPAELWYEPEDEAALGWVMTAARSAGIDCRVLGGGSNLLVSDEGVRGLVVSLSAPAFTRITRMDDGTVEAGAGAGLGRLMRFLLDAGYGDCDFLFGIPAQVGGAVAMNAGSADRWIGRYLIRGRWIDSKGSVRDFCPEEACFGYRTSGIPPRMVTSAVFDFPRDPEGISQKRLERYSDYRRKTQDLQHPSAGCMFVNPEGCQGAGWLIDQAGLKGLQIGRAAVSEIHANFVVNLGGAACADVLGVIEEAERAVDQKFGVKMRREICRWP